MVGPLCSVYGLAGSIRILGVMPERASRTAWGSSSTSRPSVVKPLREMPTSRESAVRLCMTACVGSGVVHEVDRLRRGSGLWGDLLGCDRTDVPRRRHLRRESGGLTGTLLAACIWRTRASETRTATASRNLAQARRHERLLRDTGEPAPPSLLRGDEYLLPNIRGLFDRAKLRQAGCDRPLYLTVTLAALLLEHGMCLEHLGLLTDIDAQLGCALTEHTAA